MNSSFMKLFWMISGWFCTIAGSYSAFTNKYDQATYWMVLMFYSQYNLDKLYGFGKED